MERERTREINKTKTKRRNKIQNAKEENKTRYYISNDKLKRNIFKTQRWVGLYPSITSKKKKKASKIFKDTHGWMGNKLWTFLLNNKFINGLETKQ